MPVNRLSVTVSAMLGRDVGNAARDRGVSVSSWVTGAIEASLRNRRLREALAVWEGEQGPLTKEEITEAARILDEAEQRAATRAASQPR
jgi:hypothetical protein